MLPEGLSVKVKDITGMKFGRLTVVKFDKMVQDGFRKNGNKKMQARWECLCDCGSTTFVPTGKLRCGHTKSCGCLVSEIRRRPRPEFRTQNGLGRSRICMIWRAMIQRCQPTNHNYHAWHRYGGRGIRVCDRWHDFKLFYEDMSPTYQDTLTLDRIDPDGNYEPSNCRWADRVTQARNRSKR